MAYQLVRYRVIPQIRLLSCLNRASASLNGPTNWQKDKPLITAAKSQSIGIPPE